MFNWLTKLLAGLRGGKSAAPQQRKAVAAKPVTGVPLKSDRGNQFWRGARLPVLVTTQKDGDVYTDRIPARPPMADFETKTATGAMPPQQVLEMSGNGTFISGDPVGIVRSDRVLFPDVRLHDEDA